MRTSGASFPRLLALAGLLTSGVSVADEPAPAAPAPCPTAPEATAAHCISVWVVDASGIRQLPDRCLDSSAPATTADLGAASTEQQPCDTPTFLDARGIQRVRPECLASVPSPAPLAAAAAPPAGAEQSENQRCDPPWWVDAKGIRRLKMNCLNASDATARAAISPPPPSAAQAAPAAQPSAGDACDPPSYVDSRGIRRLKINCL